MITLWTSVLTANEVEWKEILQKKKLNSSVDKDRDGNLKNLRLAD